MILQAGESDEGRDFAAAAADVIFSRYSQYDQAQAFYADVKSRLPKFGRTRDQLLILPAAGFVLGDTDAEAHEAAREIRRGRHRVTSVRQHRRRGASARSCRA